MHSLKIGFFLQITRISPGIGASARLRAKLFRLALTHTLINCINGMESGVLIGKFLIIMLD